MLDSCKLTFVTFKFLTSQFWISRFTFQTSEIAIHVLCTEIQILNLEIQKRNLGTTVEVAILNLQIWKMNLCAEYMNCNLRGLKSESQDSKLRGQEFKGRKN